MTVPELPPIPDAAIEAAAKTRGHFDCCDQPIPDCQTCQTVLDNARRALDAAQPAITAQTLRWAADRLDALAKEHRRRDGGQAVAGLDYRSALAYAVGLEQGRDQLRKLADQISGEEVIGDG